MCQNDPIDCQMPHTDEYFNQNQGIIREGNLEKIKLFYR